MKKHLIRFLLGALCVLVLLGHVGRLWQIPFVTALDAYLYDVRVRLSMPNTVDQRVVIVDIDEKSLGEVGRWPWGRNTVAEMVRRLTDDYHVAVVGFDVVFAEPDDSSGLKVLETIGRQQLKGEPGFQRALGELRSSLDYDRVLANTLTGRPVVLGYYFSGTQSAQQAGTLPPPVFPAGSFAGRDIPFVSWAGYGANLPQLQQAVASSGHFNPLVDFDGISRRVPLIVEFKGEYYEALSLAVLRHVLGEAQIKPGFPEGEKTIEWLDVEGERGRVHIPVDEQVSALIPYRGHERSFPYISAVDVLKGRVSSEQLAGRVVLVGTTAPGLMDLRATPVGGAYPGVEVHANLIAGMLAGTIKEKPGYVLAIEVLQILLFGGMLVALLPLLSPLRGTLLALATLGVTLGFGMWLWNSANLVLPVASGLLLTLLLYGFNMSWGYFVESRTKRQFTDLFGQYVPPELVDEMAKNPESYSMEGRNEELTVIFADIRSFTTLSEGMDPKELTHLMNDYLGAMTDVIRANRGTLDKYIGDAIMAFWGAPVSDPESARHALLTALNMQTRLKTLAEPFKAKGWPELHIGIGVNTGMMTVGDMGSPVRKAYTVMGDAVNLASRLEGITKEYGVGIVVGELTRERVPDVSFRELDKVKVKGKDESVAIYEPLGLTAELSAATLEELKLWQHALRLYRAQDWDQAELQLYNLSQRSPGCRLYSLYAERIVTLRASPPDESWCGVTIYQTK
ncbi:MAG: adenylate/guanylate cyclase domain-containing protein [Azonexus sp.]|nr:adenylate/guanylate cyclase domain-containing protein [Azonexus sp.]